MPLSASVYKMLAIIVAVIAFTGIVMQFDPHIADENDVLEWGQALFLLLACVAHGRRAARLTRGSLSRARRFQTHQPIRRTMTSGKYGCKTRCSCTMAYVLRGIVRPYGLGPSEIMRRAAFR